MTALRIELAFALGAALAGCRLDALDLEGKPCPCPIGYFCHATDRGGVCLTTGDSAQPIDLETPPDIALAPDQWLTGLSFSSGTLTPAFSPDVMSYELLVPVTTTSLTVTPTAGAKDVSLFIGGAAAQSGVASTPLDASVGVLNITVSANRPPASQVLSYQITMRHAHYLKPEVAGDDQLGSAIAYDGDTLVVGAPAECSNATGVDGDESDASACGNGAAFVYVRSGSTWVRQAYLKAPHASARFGAAVAISGDTIAVGAPGESSNDGAAYTFSRSASTWTAGTSLTAPLTGVSGQFGLAVALDGDTLVVSEPDPSANVIPAVYLYTASGGAFTATGTASLSYANQAFAFGAALALKDGVLVIGAPDTTTTAFGGGVVYFATATSGWSVAGPIEASNTQGGYHFGAALAFDGDTLVVGSPDESSDATGVNGDQSDQSAASAGAAYVFALRDGSFTQTAYLKASNTAAGDLFGSSVAVNGTALAVGAPGEGSSVTGVGGAETPQSSAGAGAVYLFDLSSGQLAQVQYVKALNTAAGDAFGSSLALGDDVLCAGAPDETSSGVGIDGNLDDRTNQEQVGAVYAYPLE